MNAAAMVAQVPRWRHSIEVAPGVVTPGSGHATQLLDRLELPTDLTGKTVLDVGCSDGLFSFECEQRGAKRVVALDNWSGRKVTSPVGFQTVHKLLDSKVEYREADLLTWNEDEWFDIVLCLGVVYHLRHPFLGFERLASLTREVLYLESEVLPGSASAMEFVTGAYRDDPTTWWLPTVRCLEDMAEAVGFHLKSSELWLGHRVILECGV